MQWGLSLRIRHGKVERPRGIPTAGRFQENEGIQRPSQVKISFAGSNLLNTLGPMSGEPRHVSGTTTPLSPCGDMWSLALHGFEPGTSPSNQVW